MSQWGFYFNQDRCVGCKACVVACKQWNEELRGDAAINVRDNDEVQVNIGEKEDGSVYIDPATGMNNYSVYRKFYMKEMWRNVDCFETGGVTLKSDRTFSSTVDVRYLSMGCNHCDKPACAEACPMGVIFKDEDTGIVLWNNENCISCGRCKSACPWSKPQFYDSKYATYAQNDPNRPKMTKCTLCYERIGEGLKPACVAACWNRALDAGPVDELKGVYTTAVETINEFNSGSTGPNIIFKPKTDI
ncbi:4Fe-4S dicluster domain-containing protein [Seleniivibrio woodruffii]|uniref:4Fe-4S dicluster domain-containing protein n=1 Tax=Seleniivibrio woodruffii TaxID=1078050 RepID=UPI00240964DD|nr:4Fe-4S dicluster domain-containing protein [Seleniivibrio woodruffii]